MNKLEFKTLKQAVTQFANAEKEIVRLETDLLNLEGLIGCKIAIVGRGLINSQVEMPYEMNRMIVNSLKNVLTRRIRELGQLQSSLECPGAYSNNYIECDGDFPLSFEI